jgi:glycosyltransferase involved in cell wall biosynthesis
MYSIKENHMEFYPLGGITFNEQIRKNKYNVLRNKLGLKSDDMIVLHSGKLDRTKKTLELIDAFNKIKNSKMYLVIIGSLNNDIRDIFNSKIINNEKIKYLGWKKGDELLDYLCACDLYVQPGTQSATLQNAACCCCAIATYPYPNYQLMFKDSIFYISDSNEIYELFLSISKKPKLVFEQATKSYDIALRMLDYKVLANRIYNK